MQMSLQLWVVLSQLIVLALPLSKCQVLALACLFQPGL